MISVPLVLMDDIPQKQAEKNPAVLRMRMTISMFTGLNLKHIKTMVKYIVSRKLENYAATALTLKFLIKKKKMALKTKKLN